MTFRKIKRSFLVSVWFMFLAFPIMVIRVNTIEKVVVWRWKNMLFVGIGSFLRTDKNAIKQDLEYIFALFPILAERRHQAGGP